MPLAETNLMEIVVNGQPQQVPTGCQLSGVLRHLEIDPSRVALELNGVIVKKHLWDTTPVCAGAQLEIVRFVGGG